MMPAFSIEVSATVKQQFNRFFVAIERSCLESVAIILKLVINISAVVNQKLYGLAVVEFRRCVKSGAIPVPSSIDVSARIE